MVIVGRMSVRRTLLLMRHAKSGYPEGISDHDRPLAPRGVREAGLAGDWLRANAPTIDQVLCSTATRARETLQRTGIEAPVRYADGLYGATPGIMIDEIAETPDAVAALLVVGHEPTLSGLALTLAGEAGSDDTVAQRISTKFPTSAIAVLTLGCGWSALAPRRAALVGLEVPR